MRRALRLLFTLICLIALVAGIGSASSHEVRPAYLELTETTPGAFDVSFKTPMQGDLRLALGVAVSGPTRAMTPVLSRVIENAMIQTWQITVPGSLDDRQIRVVGLETTVSDTLLSVEFLNGRRWVQRLTPAAPVVTTPKEQGGSGVAVTYLALGVEHILLGYDHLLFVLGLFLLTANLKQLIKAITAFTAAHSITLAAASLGFVHVPSRPVEAAIALSIVFVAREVIHARQGRPGLAAMAPWLMAFVFGLLHGFGFAGALSEIGMPEGHIPSSHSPRASFPRRLRIRPIVARSVRPGRKPSKPPSRPMIPDVSLPSSATNGHPIPGATTFTATSSFATAATRRAGSCPTRR